MSKTVMPDLQKKSFTCPICGVLCAQDSFVVKKSYLEHRRHASISLSELDPNRNPLIRPYPIEEEHLDNNRINSTDTYISICNHCMELAFWKGNNIIYPLTSQLPIAHDDMPESVRRIYDEAEAVFNHSPRASAALLRLAIETLIPLLELGVKKDTLNNMIGYLVKEDIPLYIQQSLDSLRYYGNKGIHAAEIDMQDDQDTVIFLFTLCNTIVEELISKKKQVEKIYALLPDRFRESIEKRDTVKG